MLVERRMNRTKGDVLAHWAKTREERRYRKVNKDEMKACLEEKKRGSAMSHLRTKKFCAKQKLESHKQKHVVPDGNKGRNS